MKLKTDDPFVPEDIRAKINGLQSLLDHAADLYSDIYSWYDSELKSYDPKATADDELFDPGTGTVVEGIDYLSIMESLSELQTATNVKCRGLTLCPIGLASGDVFPYQGLDGPLDGSVPAIFVLSDPGQDICICLHIQF